MKSSAIILFVVCCMLTACDRRGDNSTTAIPNSTAQAWKNYDEQLKQQQEMRKRDEALVTAAEDQHKRAGALLTTQEQAMQRQLDDMARFEKILDTWESQQKQYQKYLDSLPK